MSIQLVAVDLDGTLLKSDGIPAPRGIRALRAINRTGVRVVVATARRFLASDETSYAEFGFPDPLICWDGGEIYRSYKRQLWQRNPIPLDVACSILEFSDREQLEISVGYSTVVYWKRRSGQDTEPPPGVAFTENYRETLDDAPLRLLTAESRTIEALREFCTQLSPGSCRVQPYVNSEGEVSSLGISDNSRRCLQG